MSLSAEQYKRYSRQFILREVGVEGQEKLLRARVLIVGAGGLGSPQALYLAAAGVGTIGIVDSDSVELSNLPRQVLYGTRDVGSGKAETAARRLRELNEDVTIEPYGVRLSSENAIGIIRKYDYVLDGTDNFAARYLINDAAVLLGKVDVYGGISRFEAQVSVFGAPGGPCYRCLFPSPPDPGEVPSCAEAGVMGVLPGIVGLCQANEVLKLILGIGKPLVGRLLLFDALEASWREVRLPRNPLCPLCGKERRIKELVDYEEFCGSGLETALPVEGVTPVELKELLRGEPGRVALVDVRERDEYKICRLEGSILLPLSSLEERWRELEAYRDRTLVFYCHRGIRSRVAIERLTRLGFQAEMKNLEGGIDAWSLFVDPGLPRY